MRRKDKEIKDRAIIEDILKSNYICRIGLSDQNIPYIIPMNYGYNKNRIYLHSAGSGKKIDIIKNNNTVCFEVSDSIKLIKQKIACRFDISFRSVIGYGKIHIVDNIKEKIEGLNTIMYQHTGKRDWEFAEEDLKKVTILKIDIKSISGKKSNL